MPHDCVVGAGRDDEVHDVKGEIVEPGNSWGSGEGWAKVMELIEIARRPESSRRYLLLVVNVAILVYLWARRNEFKSSAAG